MSDDLRSWPKTNDFLPPTQGGPPDDFSDLDGFGSDYRPEVAFPLDIESLVNGDYDFEVLHAELKRAQGTSDRICEIALQVIGGRRIRWTWWLNKQAGVNKACADLAALGFDAAKWNTPGRPLSKELPAAIARLPSIKFRAYKSSRTDTRPGMNNKVYHDLAISCRLDGRPMPPLSAPSAPAPANGPQPVAAYSGGLQPPGKDNEIPF